MIEFSISLAIYNFLSVLLIALALNCIIQIIRILHSKNIYIAILGAYLVIIGGLSKATWKLIIALKGPALTWLASALFPLIALGFSLLAASLWLAQRKARMQAVPRRFCFFVIIFITTIYSINLIRLLILNVTHGELLPIMLLAIFSNLGLTILLINESFKSDVPWLTLLFLINLAVAPVLGFIAQIQPKTIMLHWIEQTITSLGMAGFTIGACLLKRKLINNISNNINY